MSLAGAPYHARRSDAQLEPINLPFPPASASHNIVLTRRLPWIGEVRTLVNRPRKAIAPTVPRSWHEPAATPIIAADAAY
jgi:hypothetical protein